MANKNFVVQNGLSVGSLTIDASTGSITTTGSITVTAPGSINVDSIGVSSIAKNDTSISISDTGTGSNVRIIVDGVTEHTISAAGVNLSADNSFAIDGANVLTSTTLGAAVVNSSLTNLGILTGVTVSGTTGLNTAYVSQLNSTAANVSMLYAGNFSSGNAQITGGAISGGAITATPVSGSTGHFTTAQATNFSSGNVIISGGAITATPVSGSTGHFTTAQATNFSSGNAQVTGGAISGSTITATPVSGSTGHFTTLQGANFSSGNIRVSGGYVTGLANISAVNGQLTTAQITNFSTANAQVTGGAITATPVSGSTGHFTTAQATNFSSGNAIISGGAVTASTVTGTVTTANVALHQSVTATTTNATFYPFLSVLPTGNTAGFSSTVLTFNPSTGFLAATRFVGSGAGLTGIPNDALVNSSVTVTAGDALTGGGTVSLGGSMTVNHADTSTQASVNNTAGSVIQGVTLDTYGHVTALASANLDDRYYTETESDARFINATGDNMTGYLTLHANPVSAMQAATKQYVDAAAEGLLTRPSTEIATTANLTATYNNGASGVGATLTATVNGAFPTIDSITLTSILPGENGVLVKDQSNAAHNGRYNLTQVGNGSTPWILTRCGLCDEASEIPGSYVFVKRGTEYANTGWVQSVANPTTFVVGTDAISVIQFSGAGTFLPGTGLTLSGSTFNVGGTADRITVGATAVDIASTYVGQTSITTLGTVGAGTWSASTIAVNRGGTGLTSYTNGQLLIGNSTGNTLTAATLTGTANRILITNGASSITINADAASTNTANKIVARDASGNFSAGTITAALSGNATTATTLQTARTIALTGDVTYTSGAFNGAGNVTGTATLANSGVVAGTYAAATVTVDAKGRVTSASANTIGNGTLTLATSGIATGSQTFAANQETAATFTVAVPGTDIAEGTRTTTTVPITSSTGTNATLSAATGSLAGVMSSADKTKLDGIAAGAQVNVATDLGITAGTTAGPVVTSSTGTNATLPTASATASGVVTTGAQTWAGVKTFNSTITGSVSGNAGTATTLQTARAINGVNFNGAAAITVEPFVERDDATAAVRYLTFVDDNVAGHKRLNMDTDLSYNPSTNVLSTTATAAQYADLAEYYAADAAYTPGTVLMFGGDAEVTLATAETTAVAGVVSTNPAHVMNSNLCAAHAVVVALTGRVPCRVTGPVRKGDLMVASADGKAKSSTDPKMGQVIGKALTDVPADFDGIIEVVVGRL